MVEVEHKQKAFFVDEEELLGRKASLTSKRRQKKVSSLGLGCSACGLDKKCRTPKIKIFGEGKKKILLVGINPGKEEDKVGVAFVGESGVFMKDILDVVDIDMDVDCKRKNLVACAKLNSSGNYTTPNNHEIQCCASFLLQDIKDFSPKMIICLGEEVVNSLIKPIGMEPFRLYNVHGKVFPSHRFNCWVGCSYHPAYFLRSEKNEDHIFAFDLEKILSYIDKPLPSPLTEDGNCLVVDSNIAIEVLRSFSLFNKPIAFDYETTGISSYEIGADILSVALSDEVESAFGIWLANPKWNIIERAYVFEELKSFLESDVPKVVQNFNMEALWSRNVVGAKVNNLYMDTMVTCHVVNCKNKETSLEFQVYEMVGAEYKNMVNKNNLAAEPYDRLLNYNCFDARYTLMACRKLEGELDEHTSKFNSLVTESLPALASLKDRGVQIDVVQLDAFIARSEEEIKEYERNILFMKEVKEFERKYNLTFNINSNPQISDFLYGFMGVPVSKLTEKGGKSVDKHALDKIVSTIKEESVKYFVDCIQKQKKSGSFIRRCKEYKGLLDPKGKIHPDYNMNIAASMRSSSTNPNIQQVFKHDEELIEFRKCIIPSLGNLLMEADYKGLEIAVIAMISGDTVLRQQIKDKYDLHRYWAARILNKKESEISKEFRSNVKSGFVFPSFYGSKPHAMKHHFVGISEDRLKKVQSDFWSTYVGVRSWIESMERYYNEYGYILCATNFKRWGPLSDYQIRNTPIQGPGFHLTLKALKIFEDMIVNNTWKLSSVPIVEIHDAIVFDVVPDEVEALMLKVENVMTDKMFPWQLDIPLEINWEIGENWLEMKEI